MALLTNQYNKKKNLLTGISMSKDIPTIKSNAGSSEEKVDSTIEDGTTKSRSNKLTLVNLREKISNAISEAEKKMDEVIRQEEESASERSREREMKLEREIEFYDLQMMLRQQNEEAIREYLAVIRSRDDDIAKGRSTFKIAKAILSEHEPLWLKCMNEAIEVLEEYSYIAKTWWRPRFQELITVAIENFEKSNEHGKYLQFFT